MDQTNTDQARMDGPDGEPNEPPAGGYEVAADLIMGAAGSSPDPVVKLATVMDRLALEAHLRISAVDLHWQIAIHLWPALKAITSSTGRLSGSLAATGIDADMLAGVGPHPHYPRDPGRLLTFHAPIPPTTQWPHQDLPGYALDSHGDPGRYDLVLINMAFHDVALLDPARRTRLGAHHHQVLDSALDRTLPGGLTVALASPVFLDHPDPDMRRAIAERADLVGAVRLPAGAMRPDSYAQGPTDVLILHHRHPGQPGPGIPASIEVSAGGRPGRVNEYWLDNPDHVLGHLQLSEPGPATVQPGHEPLGRLMQVAFDQIATDATALLTASPSTSHPAPPPELPTDLGPAAPGDTPRL